MSNEDVTKNDRSNLKEKKATKKKTSKRKYVNYVLMIISIILIVFIAFKMYNRFQDNKLSESVLTRIVGTIQYDDIDNAINEMTTDGFILISYLKNEDVNKFEITLRKAVTDNDLQSNFYYLDATNLMLEEGYINSLNEKFNLSGHNEIKALPAILYYSEGKLKKTITSTENQMLTVDDFNKMLDSYEIIDSKK